LTAALSMRVFAQAPPAQSAAVQTLEQRYKNIQALKGVPGSQIYDLMSLMAGSLGVTCAYCHTTAYDSDEKQPKQTSRQMIRMMTAINQEHFGGKTIVSCNTCHGGRTTPIAVPPLSQSGWNKASSEAADETSFPTPAEILQRYVKSIGGDNLTNIAHRITTGTVTRMNGRTAPVSDVFEFDQTSEKAGISTKLSYPPEGNQSLIAGLTQPLKWNAAELKMRVSGRERIRDRVAYVVEIPLQESMRQILFFDIENGLLLRKRLEKPTALGVVLEERDFQDYRLVDKMSVPFLMEWSRADYRVTFQVSDVKHVLQ
jgi:hypothetical protein